MEHLQPGDHLVVNVDVFGITEHHGLYIGNDEVIHLCAHSKQVILSCLATFSDEKEIRVKRRALYPQDAIDYARHQLGKRGYDVATNNCEHFVNRCLKQRHTSNQVSNSGHAIVHVAARQGLLGQSAKQFAKGPLGTIAIASTGAKYAGEYIGLPDSVNTVVGAPGDLVAKPIEAAYTGTVNTLSNTYDKLSEGEIIGATGELITGTVETAVDVVFAPIEVVGNTWSAIKSWFD
ncbi:lecithin retinol acyltransferase family protein [Vibrio lentus]|nr:MULTISPECIES: lecithin retinol acyltransferase family protein [Vibrio]PMH91905.1 acyltransferase [Vibrio splendidus]PMI56347.1 acyltransferase [Vibrio lentus]PMI85403.1 acyltransferase [Vibrio lentus]PMJ63265.1 acyltransferase [Vibrio splendidus]PMM08735.1 acyltransferase [Vibrio splendidus]